MCSEEVSPCDIMEQGSELVIKSIFDTNYTLTLSQMSGKNNFDAILSILK